MQPKTSIEKQDSKEFSFIHASDLHLGSHQYRNEERAEDFIDALKEVLFYANLHQVDFILLGGDVFDSLEMLPGRLFEIISVLRSFKLEQNNQIKIIAIEGNHDIRRHSFGVRFKYRGQSWLKILASLDLIILLDADLDAFSEVRFPFYDYRTHKGGKIRIKDAIIYGTRYLGEIPKEEIVKIKEGLDENKELFHILLQHFGIEGQMKDVPGIPYHDVKCLKENVQYLALGHFHVQYKIDDWIFNPGSTEAACTSDFFFNRGIILVQVKFKDGYVKDITELKLSNRKAIWLTISLKVLFTKRELLEKYILNFLKNKFGPQKFQAKSALTNKEPCLFLKLTGIQPSKTCKIKEKELNQLICDNFSFITVKIYQKFMEPVKSITIFI